MYDENGVYTIGYTSDNDGLCFYHVGERMTARLYWTLQLSPTGKMLMSAWAYRLVDRKGQQGMREKVLASGYCYEQEEAAAAVQTALEEYFSVTTAA